MPTPNILLLFTDMQRADTIGALGNDLIQTPNLDRLVRQGTSFTRCYSPSPVCVPARCCMHYGLYPQRTGLFVNGRMMDDNQRSYAGVLSDNGYTTTAIGKCHFTPDSLAKRGFDQRITQEEIVSDYSRDDYRTWLKEKGLDPVEAHGERGPMYYIPQPSRFRGGSHPTEWIADQTINQVKEMGATGQPWCLMSSFVHPHPPLTPPKPWTKLYPPEDMPLPHLPEQTEGLLTHINRTQNRYKWRDNGTDMNLLRMIRSYYYATVSFVDYQVGRILDSLEEQGTLDNTLILFSSDHGEYLGDYGCYGKRSMHDASARVPLIARLPGQIAADQICEEPTSLIDIMPTMLGTAGIDAGDVDGQDLRDVASGKVQREFVYSQWGKGKNAIYMIASKDWKYIYSAGERKEILFNRITDPLESRNLAEDSDSESPRKSLKGALLDYLQECGDDEAVCLESGNLEWREHPILKQDYLKEDTDLGLLYQDEQEGLPEKIDDFDFPKRKKGQTTDADFTQRMFYGD